MTMIALILMLLSIGCFYVASGRVEFKPIGWMTEHPQICRIIGWLFTVLSLILLIRDLGLAKGIFVGLILWPTLASIIILFVPFLSRRIIKN